MPDTVETREIHEELLYGLKMFHSFCMEKGIQYSLHGGTLLGAVREKGFIPWDDDVDLTLTRENYNKLLTLKEELCESLNCSVRYGSDLVPKVVFERPGRPEAVLDIFIYDAISEKKLVQKWKFILLAVLMVLKKDAADLRITRARKQYTGVKYGIIYAISLFGALIGRDRLVRRIENLQQAYGGSGICVHRSNDRYVGAVIVLNKAEIDRYELMPFEDAVLMISSGYRAILESSYGPDYMTPKYDDGNSAAHEALLEIFQERNAKT